MEEDETWCKFRSYMYLDLGPAVNRQPLFPRGGLEELVTSIDNVLNPNNYEISIEKHAYAAHRKRMRLTNVWPRNTNMKYHDQTMNITHANCNDTNKVNLKHNHKNNDNNKTCNHDNHEDDYNSRREQNEISSMIQ